MTETRWFTERDISHLSGLPGPLVAELLPRPPAPDAAGYTAVAEVYDEASIYRARLALMLLRAGIRLRYIRLVMHQPQTTEQLKDACEQWEHSETATSPHPHPPALTPTAAAAGRVCRRARIYGRRDADPAVPDRGGFPRPPLEEDSHDRKPPVHL